MAIQNKIRIDRGTTFLLDFYYTEASLPVSLVGGTVRFTIKSVESDSSITDSTAVVTKNITTGDVNGYAQIELDPADTQTVTPGRYHYDIKVEKADGTITKAIEGICIIDGSPTNRIV